MKTISLTQSQIAVLTATYLTLALPLPTSLPHWDGSHLDAYKATKQLLAGSTPERKF
jgi:hypothetical protein